MSVNLSGNDLSDIASHWLRHDGSSLWLIESIQNACGLQTMDRKPEQRHQSRHCWPIAANPEYHSSKSLQSATTPLATIPIARLQYTPAVSYFEPC